MKVVMWIRNEPIQVALANRVAEEHDLVGVVMESPRTGRITASKVIEKVTTKLSAASVDKVWNRLLLHYDELYPGLPGCNALVVPSINDPKVVKFTEDLSPDVIMVSGTQIVRGNLLNIETKRGIINLHTGLSPYVKGGPNCTNWCLAMGDYHLIGNTVMWLDAGIDTGNIIASETTDLSGEEDLFKIHIKVLEHAHDLYLRALECLSECPEKVPNTPQSEIGKGKTWFNKDWNTRRRKQLLENMRTGEFQKVVSSPEFDKKRSELKTINLPKCD